MLCLLEDREEGLLLRQVRHYSLHLLSPPHRRPPRIRPPFSAVHSADYLFTGSTHHVQHWKTGHKASCGTPDAEIAIPSSFPTHASARHPSLTSLSNLLKKNVNGFWGFQLQGRSVGLVFPPGFDSFSAQDKVDALAEFRRIAFRACDVGAVDEVSSGAMALLLEAFNSDLANFVFEEELERMAAMYKLEAGAAGARAMRRRMGTARDAIESGGFPFTKRIIDYFLPLAYVLSFTLSFS